jgi:ABC-type nitrate/sulfonate/bicarbonate transport system substrate-binding protein
MITLLPHLNRIHMRSRALTSLALASAVSMVMISCGSDTASTPTDTITSEVQDAEEFPADRCAANQAAGTITFLTGFDYAAAASIVEVIYAAELGYYEDLCLDVEILSSFSTANYPLIAGGQGQFASGGSFSEVVAFAAANQADLVAVMVAGSTPIDTLIMKPDAPADLTGSTIGVKGKMPASIEVMLLRAGLTNGVDYTTVPVDGFDPTAHIAIPSIIGFPGWKSNEPGRLQREGIEFRTLDPTEAQIPGSFGAIFTSRSFIDQHPTAAEDFVRATLRGLASAIADPAAAAAAAVNLVIANGNPNFLSPEGEVFRWATEAELISSRTPAGVAAGTPDPLTLEVEVSTYAEVGFFGPETTPQTSTHVNADLARTVTKADGGTIWPLTTSR